MNELNEWIDGWIINSLIHSARWALCLQSDQFLFHWCKSPPTSKNRSVSVEIEAASASQLYQTFLIPPSPSTRTASEVSERCFCGSSPPPHKSKAGQTLRCFEKQFSKLGRGCCPGAVEDDRSRHSDYRDHQSFGKGGWSGGGRCLSGWRERKEQNAPTGPEFDMPQTSQDLTHPLTSHALWLQGLCLLLSPGLSWRHFRSFAMRKPETRGLTITGTHGPKFLLGTEKA